MYFLGISGGVLIGNQDGAAALLKDGEIVAAVEEERMMGVKHASGWLPRRAIHYCLKQAGISIRDVAGVGFPGLTYDRFDSILNDYFQFQFGYAPPVRLFDHHTAHAASTFFVSGFERSLVLTADFSGDRMSTKLFLGEGTKLRLLKEIGKPDSLGIFYSVLTQYLGFEKDDEEYKVMGLSSYGKPTHDFSKILEPWEDAYRFNVDYLKSTKNPERPAPSKQECLFTSLPLPEPPRLPDGPITQYHMDIAASGQVALEKAVLNLIEHAVKKTGVRKLCLAGGVALNCVMNRKIRETGLLDDLFVPPHTSDAGLSIGCGILQGLEQGEPRPKAMEACYWGPGYSEEEIKKALDLAFIRYERPMDICETVAEDLIAGKIVGWFQGRMEFGPRALGNRSILADCRRAEMKDRVNALVKFREEFRPFAPSVLEEAAADYFENAIRSPYMAVTFHVKKEKRGVVPAITHVDGTARVQTVSQKDNPLYHQLISTFHKKTGVPMVLNTSLNVRGQPVALDARAALSVFYTSGLEGLALGPFYIRKQ